MIGANTAKKTILLVKPLEVYNYIYEALYKLISGYENYNIEIVSHPNYEEFNSIVDKNQIIAVLLANGQINTQVLMEGCPNI